MTPFQAHPLVLAGRGTAVFAGILAVLAFVAVPWVSLGILGNYTALQVAQFANPELHMQQLAYLWFALLLAVIITIFACISFFAPTQDHVVSVTIISLAALAFVGMIAMYIYLGQQRILAVPLTAFLGTGFWLYTGSVALAFSGGVMLLIGCSRYRK